MYKRLQLVKLDCNLCFMDKVKQVGHGDGNVEWSYAMRTLNNLNSDYFENYCSLNFLTSKFQTLQG